jgi:hypothetical protein
MTDGHPTDIELQNRATFRLPLREGVVIDDHLRACEACIARYRDLTPNQPWAPPVPEAVNTDTNAKQ